MLATVLCLALGEGFYTAQYSPAILTSVAASGQIWPAPMVQKSIMLYLDGLYCLAVWNDVRAINERLPAHGW